MNFEKCYNKMSERFQGISDKQEVILDIVGELLNYAMSVYDNKKDCVNFLYEILNWYFYKEEINEFLDD